MEAILQQARQLQETIVKDRRYLHQHAELSHDLPVTSAYVMERLREMGYEPKEICKSAVVALAGGKKPGKTFLLRADMDALPVPEETGLPFSSITPNMHACGHDTHAAMLLGAAKILKDHEDEIEGTVKLMFQPAEETLSGAKAMIAAGLLENPKVDAAAMLHIASGLPIPAGTLLMPRVPYASSSADMFHIDIAGKGGHGSMPHLAVDPLNVAAHILISLQELAAWEVDPSSHTVLTIGQIHGGNAANILSDTVFMEGTIRCFNNEERQYMKRRVVEIAQGVAAVFRATVNVEYRMECPCVKNDKNMYERVWDINRALFGEDNVQWLEVVYPTGRMPGSEDFGYVSELVPTTTMWLGGGSPEQGYPYQQHHPKVDFMEDVFHIGSAALANTALEWLRGEAKGAASV